MWCPKLRVACMLDGALVTIVIASMRCCGWFPDRLPAWRLYYRPAPISWFASSINRPVSSQRHTTIWYRDWVLPRSSDTDAHSRMRAGVQTDTEREVSRNIHSCCNVAIWRKEERRHENVHKLSLLISSWLVQGENMKWNQVSIKRTTQWRAGKC